MDETFFPGVKIGVAGLGLIGGSLAMAFHKAGFSVAGYDIDAATIRAAMECGGAGKAALTPETVLDADFLFVALYPEQIIEFVRENADNIKKGAVLIDCCGIKGHVVGPLEQLAAENGFYFIGGHPMAGTERSGFAAARADLFDGASFILTPPQGVPEEICERVKALVKTAGFGRVVVTAPSQHDRLIAFTSQLPHVIACAYVKSPCCPHHRGFSAGSFRDVSRVAHINPELWAGLFIDNEAPLCEEIDILIDNLRQLRETIASKDNAKLTALLRQARELKDGADNAG